MVYRVIYSEDELYHWGIKGMRWGVRRYQRENGTWTETGKRRRRLSPDAQKRADRKNQIKNLKSKSELDTAKASYKVNKAINKQAVKEARGEKPSIKERLSGLRKKTGLENSKENAIKSGDAKKVQKAKSQMTDEELKQAINRIQLDNQLSAVQAQQKQKGIDAYKKVADVANTTASLTKNGIEIYNNVAKVMNTFNVGGKSDRKIIGEKTSGGEDSLQRRLREAQVRSAEANAERNELTLRNLRNQGSGQTSSTTSDTSSGSNRSDSNTSRQTTSASSRSTSESNASTRSSGANSLLGSIRSMNNNIQELQTAERRVRTSYGVNSDEYREIHAAREAATRIRDIRGLQYRTNTSASLSDTAMSNAAREVDRLIRQERTQGTFDALSNVDNLLERYRDLDD